MLDIRGSAALVILLRPILNPTRKDAGHPIVNYWNVQDEELVSVEFAIV